MPVLELTIIIIIVIIIIVIIIILGLYSSSQGILKFSWSVKGHFVALI